MGRRLSQTQIQGYLIIMRIVLDMGFEHSNSHYQLGLSQSLSHKHKTGMQLISSSAAKAESDNPQIQKKQPIGSLRDSIESHNPKPLKPPMQLDLHNSIKPISNHSSNPTKQSPKSQTTHHHSNPKAKKKK